MRLDRYLANAGIGTRKEVKKLIKEKHVKIDNNFVTDSSFSVDFNTQVYLDGKLVDYKEFYYVLLNKPKGYISATYDDYHQVVLDLIPEYKKYKVAPVGRLDIDTTGVMLLTNNGSLSHILLSPKRHVDKTYLAEVNHKLDESLISNFKDGVILDDGYNCLPAKLEIVDDFRALLTIHEGKFHQVKRMFQVFGYEVISLDRISFANLTYANLKQGEYRELTEEETKYLLDLANL